MTCDFWLGHLLFVRNRFRQVQTTKAVATRSLGQHRRDHLCDGCRLRFAVQRRLLDFSQAQRISRSAFRCQLKSAKRNQQKASNSITESGSLLRTKSDTQNRFMGWGLPCV